MQNNAKVVNLLTAFAIFQNIVIVKIKKKN